MVKGILADANAVGLVKYLVGLMQAEPWEPFWRELGLALYQFEDIGLVMSAIDLEIWTRCQAEQLILITDNRNEEAPDSLAVVMRKRGRADSLPVFTIADMQRFRSSREYVDQVVLTAFDYLLRIDELRGTGRLYLP